MAVTIKDSLGLKSLIIIGVVIGLTIPLFLMRTLLDERQSRSTEAERTVAQTWGGPLTLAGPVLRIPFKVYHLNEKGEKIFTEKYLHQLPKALKIQAEAQPQVRNLGIFKIPVFTSQWTLTGTFAPLEKDLGQGENLHSVAWSQAQILLEVPDYQSLSGPVKFQWNQIPLDLELVAQSPLFFSKTEALGTRIGLTGPLSSPQTFTLQLAARGSQSLGVLPLGDETTFDIKSSWPSPLFTQGILPETSKITPEGFDAHWNLFSTSRGLPSRWVEDSGSGSRSRDVKMSVSLTNPVDQYLLSDRALKYGLLFIILPMALMFLLEVFTRSRFHPLHYLIVGLAMVLFYLVLLALSEHLTFEISFLAAALAVILLMTFYLRGLTLKPSQGLVLAPVLLGMFTYLFAALQSEDYALLIGSLGIFGIFALVVIATRKVNWFNLTQTKTPAPAPENP